MMTIRFIPLQLGQLLTSCGRSTFLQLHFLVFNLDNVTSLMASSSPARMIPTQRRHVSLCSVCGDKASGKHYGVMSCDGCRGFFKRSVRRRIEYKCKGDSRCQVDVSRRNQCQACRFQRCLAVKMKPNAVQNERAPRLPSKQALPTASLPRTQCWTPPTVGYVAKSPSVTMPIDFRNISTTNTSSPIWSTARMYPLQQSFNLSKCSTSSDVSNNDETHSSLEENSLRIQCETASYVLLESVRWIYSVPSFKQLNEYDQWVLIEQSWPLLFLLTSAETKKFLDQNDVDVMDDDNQYISFQTIIKEIIRHTLDQTEYALVKLILVFNNPTDVQPQDRLLIDKYRNDALFMLTDYTSDLKYRRIAELLLLLSNLPEKVKEICLEKLFFQHLLDRISMKNLLHNIIRHFCTFTR
ncbi:unnamed protein product [Adineta ricciae]|uniref:Uncharacterized protein n=1 Tax=Adineta ricciae TaxID=249248 RepID=A0A814ZJZ4_ADIRI|nr:unnamed protein product [Adineta ricciae]